MGKLNIMDHSGHRVMNFDDPSSPDYASVEAGQKAFDALLAGGAKMAAKQPDGTNKLVTSFDPNAEMVQVPQLTGG